MVTFRVKKKIKQYQPFAGSSFINVQIFGWTKMDKMSLGALRSVFFVCFFLHFLDILQTQ